MNQAMSIMSTGIVPLYKLYSLISNQPWEFFSWGKISNQHEFNRKRETKLLYFYLKCCRKEFVSIILE